MTKKRNSEISKKNGSDTANLIVYSVTGDLPMHARVSSTRIEHETATFLPMASIEGRSGTRSASKKRLAIAHVHFFDFQLSFAPLFLLICSVSILGIFET